MQKQGVPLAMRVLFTLTLFLSSWLLFMVQPMVGRMILPTFGGTPAVWNTSMVFFQAVLLAGYAYAHGSVAKLGMMRQPWIHLGLMLVPFLFLPIAPPLGWVSGGAVNPSLQVLAVLAMGVGIPFFVLSAGAPIIQRWFADTNDPRAHDPYFLYRASNLGSLLALLAYPFLLEPNFRLKTQAYIWSVGYALLVLAMVLCALFLRKQKAERPAVEQASQDHRAITWKRRLYWIVLAAVPTSLLLGVTTYLTSNLTPIPLLWVVPLALYLATFIIAFAPGESRLSVILSRILPLMLAPMALVMILESSEPFWVLGPLHLLVFGVAATLLHRRLAEDRPGSQHLTEFYLCISIGGVIGGAFNGLLAPVIFSTVAEYPMALVLAALLRVPRDTDAKVKPWDYLYPATVGVVTIALYWVSRNTELLESLAERAKTDSGPLNTALTMGVPAILVFLAADRRLRFGLALGVLFFVATVLHLNSRGNVVLAERSFFGVTRVVETTDGRLRQLVHGNTLHGIQNTEPSERRTPLTYYHPTGPIGDVFRAYQGTEVEQNVALVGLGVGSLAAYGRPGEQMTFFEIDPLVEKIARDRSLFTFLEDSQAQVDVVIGDARLMLKSTPKAPFGMIVLDAFSSDSIPIHLLTREAMVLYVSKLKPGGIVAFHLSNRYLELRDTVAATGASLGLVSAYRDEEAVTDDERIEGKTASKWLVMARTPADLEPILKNPEWTETETRAGNVWTDDFSNLLSVFQP